MSPAEHAQGTVTFGTPARRPWVRSACGRHPRTIICAVAHARGHSVEDYLEAIYFLVSPIGEYQPADGSPANAARVADMLGVSRAAVGEMLKRMGNEGLLKRDGGRELVFTKAGAERAEQVVRSHRIIERFLTDFLGYSAAGAHEHADALGDSFTPDMIERMNERLGFPDRCPHGWPISPDAERAENAQLVALSDLDDGRRLRGHAPRRARRRPAALVLRRGLRARRDAVGRRRPARRRAT